VTTTEPDSVHRLVQATHISLASLVMCSSPACRMAGAGRSCSGRPAGLSAAFAGYRGNFDSRLRGQRAEALRAPENRGGRTWLAQATSNVERTETFTPTANGHREPDHELVGPERTSRPVNRVKEAGVVGEVWPQQSRERGARTRTRTRTRTRMRTRTRTRERGRGVTRGGVRCDSRDERDAGRTPA
jgi:hypothetical protein